MDWVIEIIDWTILSLASTFFSGFIPGKFFGKPGKGAGTISSFITLIFLIGAVYYQVPASTIGEAAIISLLLGLICIGPAERFILKKWGPQVRHTGEVVTHDFNETNIDEVHGQLVASWPVFFFGGTTKAQIFYLILSFVLFRLYDIAKPWPVDLIEDQVPGAWGVMLDDTVAGFMAAVIIWGIMLIFH